MDMGNIQFNANHKVEAAARDASTAMRLMLLGFIASLCSLGLSIAGLLGAVSNPLLSIGIIALLLVSLAGVYGAYLAANALDWPGAATAAIVLGAFVPYIKFVIWIILFVFSLDLVRKAGYAPSLFGRLQKRAVA